MSKTFKGAGIVWRDNEMIARFEKGVFTTDDPKIIAVLEEMGYLCIAEDAPVADTKKAGRSKTAMADKKEAPQGQDA